MNTERKKKVLAYLKIALEAVMKASMAAGPVNDADECDVALCIHIENAVADIKAAQEELE